MCASNSASPLYSQCSPSFDRAISAGSESLSTPQTLTPPIHQDQQSVGLLSSLPNDWWGTTHPEFSFPEVPSVAPTSAQLFFPEDNHFPAVQSFHSRPFNTASLKTTSIEGSTRHSCTASANGVGTNTSPETPTLPLSPQSFSDFDIGLNEDLAAAEQSSNSGARRPGPSKRRRKPGGPSSKHTKPLACPDLACLKTFPRRLNILKPTNVTSNATFLAADPGDFTKCKI